MSGDRGGSNRTSRRSVEGTGLHDSPTVESKSCRGRNSRGGVNTVTEGTVTCVSTSAVQG